MLEPRSLGWRQSQPPITFFFWEMLLVNSLSPKPAVTTPIFVNIVVELSLSVTTTAKKCNVSVKKLPMEPSLPTSM